MSDELDDVLNEFIIESYENLDSLDRELVTLEQDATADSLASIFRAIHTIKGTSGFFGFEHLESVAHVGENLLSKLRDGQLAVDQEIVSALLSMVDAIREMIGTIESSGGTEGDADHSTLIAALERLERGEPAAAPVASRPDAGLDAGLEPDAGPDAGLDAGLDTEPEPDQPAELVHVEPEPDLLVEPVPTEAGEPTGVGAAATPSAAAADAGSTSTSGHAGNESIRVDVGLLDDLMNLVGELVLARNQILQYTGTQADSTFNATTQRLNLITTELQEGVMRTRMQPIENVWNKFPRVVRDLSVACGKQANLVMEGKHTELDKTLLEAIKDPLTHLVRNSVDHGLETPQVRTAVGKPAEGVVRLRAYHEGGQVIIEISDDGHGIDPAVIRRKAVEKGLMTSEEAANRTDREIVNVIFQPGFSTADAVTNISGRGVGMDVVRTNIESIGGSVDVQSQVGVGTTFKVKIPLTLAIIPALVVTCDQQRFAIPQVSLLELVRIDGHDPRSTIELVHGVPVYRLRGQLLPLVFLSEVLGGGPVAEPETLSIVVLQADEQQFGLVVDQINDTAEIVVKPMGRLLKHAVGFSGATIMGDGLVALILDVAAIAHRAQVSATSDRTRSDAEQVDEVVDDRSSVLLVGVDERRFVLPLDTVARLEEFQRADVREAGNHQVVRYRGAILPLVRLADRLGIAGGPATDALQVLVCGSPERQVGLIVDSIHDIADDRLDVSPRTTTHRGILGTAIVQGQVTDVLDLATLVSGVVPDLTLEEELAA